MEDSPIHEPVVNVSGAAWCLEWSKRALYRAGNFLDFPALPRATYNLAKWHLGLSVGAMQHGKRSESMAKSLFLELIAFHPAAYKRNVKSLPILQFVIPKVGCLGLPFEDSDLLALEFRNPPTTIQQEAACRTNTVYFHCVPLSINRPICKTVSWPSPAVTVQRLFVPDVHLL